MDRAVATLYPDWPQQASRIRSAIAGLGAEQLALRAGPAHAPVWELAAHLAGMRVYWLCSVFGEPGAERTPFADTGWDDDESNPRSGEELALALDASFEVVRDVLARWTVDDLERTAERTWNGVTQVHTRASVLNRLFSHDAYHAGEISQLLGLHDLGAIDLWARRPPTP
jgi:uncharacterized damage-inducible protein DinB